MGNTEPMKESDIQRAILSTFGALPWMRLFRQQAGRIRTDEGYWVQLAPPGAADLTGWICVPSARMPTGEFYSAGRRIELEIKSARGRVSPQQQRWRDACLAGGVLHIVARSIDDVWTALRAEGYPCP